MSILIETAQKYLQQLSERCDLSALDKQQHQELLTILSLSDFVADALIKQLTLLHTLLESNVLNNKDRTQAIKVELQTVLEKTHDENQLHQVLRQFRRKHMVIIAWRELLDRSTLEESIEHIS